MFRRIEVNVTPEWVAAQAKKGHFTYSGLQGAMMIGGRGFQKLPRPARNKDRYHENERTRWFFTEYGWRQCGHLIMSSIRATGLHARVIVFKEKDSRLKIIYRDRWQVNVVISAKKGDQ